jgi:hypothetical protein
VKKIVDDGSMRTGQSGSVYPNGAREDEEFDQLLEQSSLPSAESVREARAGGVAYDAAKLHVPDARSDDSDHLGDEQLLWWLALCQRPQDLRLGRLVYRDPDPFWVRGHTEWSDHLWTDLDQSWSWRRVYGEGVLRSLVDRRALSAVDGKIAREVVRLALDTSFEKQSEVS